MITVTDNGPGLPEDKLEAVFEPFVRLEASRSRDTGGVGLGLAPLPGPSFRRMAAPSSCVTALREG